MRRGAPQRDCDAPGCNYTQKKFLSEGQPVADASVDAAGTAAEVRVDVRKDGAGVTHRNGEARAYLYAGGAFPGPVHAEAGSRRADGRQRGRGFPGA